MVQSRIRLPVSQNDTDDEDSLWAKVTSNTTQFGWWLQSEEGKRLPTQIREALKAHRRVFPDRLLALIPQYPHMILILSDMQPSKAAIYRMPPDQLHSHAKNS